MDPLMLLFLLIAGLTGADSVSTVGQVTVQSGGSVTIPCFYDDLYKPHVKYWCKEKYWNSCTPIVRTGSPQEGKVSIRDVPEQRVFNVTMNNLTVGDSGWYSCFVNVSGASDAGDRVYLSVIEGTRLGTSTALCEGNFTCKENEVCVRPNECRCRHGYFGVSCDTKCPSQFWGPDCKGKCMCHPNGQCDDVTGECTCNPNRWGPNCENACSCQKGKCDQATGKCSCNPGVWGPQCSQVCYCSVNSVCEQTTGRCICNPGYYGRNCGAQCVCNGSPCEQFTGRCQCRERLWGPRCERYCQCVHGRCNPTDGSCTCSPGYRGKFCREPCPAGFYGQNCRHRCGHCKGQQPCKVTEGRCVTCEQGWNGTKCDQMCAPGFFGENCKDVCPPCKDGHFCSRFDGKCSHCNPGWTGDRCETRCPNGTYGENCDNNCSHCFNGDCHFETGECLCDPGFHGTFCNLTCESGQYGVNCAQTCPCHDRRCNPISGACNLYGKNNEKLRWELDAVLKAGTGVFYLICTIIAIQLHRSACQTRGTNQREAEGGGQYKHGS